MEMHIVSKFSSVSDCAQVSTTLKETNLIRCEISTGEQLQPDQKIPQWLCAFDKFMI